jgi:hypothetical protein
VVATLTFTVTGNEPIRCSTLSSSEGVDFRFTRISRINSIVQTTEDVCTISVQSTAEPGDTNARESTLAAASTFSITDTAGNTQTTLSGSPQSIWVQRIARPVISLSATTETANVNAAINGYTVTSSGGTVASYSLTGTLPAGLSFSTTTGRITGTPTAAQTATTYTITATNTSGSGTATFTLTVVQTCANGGECIVGNTGPGGGIVFYVSAANFTSTGSDCNTTCKYLEAAPTNWLTGTPVDPARTWANGDWDGTGNNDNRSVTTSNAIGSGYQNSLNIIAQTGNTAGNSAGVLAREYRGGTKTDWYLPSKVELNQLCKWARGQEWVSDLSECDRNIKLNGATNGFCCFWYWSSTQQTGSNGSAAAYWMIDSIDPLLNEGLAKANAGRVRPVRAFGPAG